MINAQIVCDLDGCVADFNNGFRQLLEKISGESIPVFDNLTAPKEWEWPLSAVKSPATVREAWAYVKSHPEWWGDLLPLPISEDALSLLSLLAMKRHVIFATARPSDNKKSLHHVTRGWIEKVLGIPSPTLLLCDRPKALLAGLLDATHLIEDNLKGFQGPLIVKGFLVDRPYNQGKLPLGVERVPSFEDALQRIAKEVLDRG